MVDEMRRGRVVDDDIETSKLILTAAEHFPNLSIAGHVAPDRHSANSAISGCGGGRFRLLPRARIIDRHVKPASGHLQGYSPANSCPATGNQRYLVRFVRHHVIP